MKQMDITYVKLGLRVLLLSDLRERICDQPLWLKRSIAELARFRCFHPLNYSLVQLKHVLEYRSQTHTAAGLVERDPQRDTGIFKFSLRSSVFSVMTPVSHPPLLGSVTERIKVELNWFYERMFGIVGLKTCSSYEHKQLCSVAGV